MSTTATITDVGARPISGRIVTQRIGPASSSARGLHRSAMWSHEWLGKWMPGASFLVQAVRLAVAIGVALLVLAGSAWLLRIREFNQGVALVTRRLRRPAR